MTEPILGRALKYDTERAARLAAEARLAEVERERDKYRDTVHVFAREHDTERAARLAAEERVRVLEEALRNAIRILRQPSAATLADWAEVHRIIDAALSSTPPAPTEPRVLCVCGHPKQNHHPANGCVTEPFTCMCRAFVAAPTEPAAPSGRCEEDAHDRPRWKCGYPLPCPFHGSAP